jgi:hypothetical protein
MPNNSSGQTGFAGLRRGDLVTVRSLDEILATLDADAALDGLPFMPEMVPYCGKTFRVHRRAEKTCVEGVGFRGMEDTVFLEGLRCDGSAHDGCQRGCLFFWKEAWLKAVESGQWTVDSGKSQVPSPDPLVQHSSLSVQHLPLPTTKGDRFYCQSTELAQATGEFRLGKLQLYLRDLRLGEITLRRFLYVIWLALTNRLWRLLRGRGFYQLTGAQKQTLRADLNLQPGELVEIKSPAEIEATLDAQGRNRGLSFEPEMAQLCGRRYRVATPIRKIIVEETGKMVQLNNTVILEGLVCQGICVKNCPRANYFYWREIWLKRV